MTTAGDGLGRYGSAGGGPVREVRLLGAPVRLWDAGREHHDALVRELRLLALAQRTDGGAASVPARLSALVRVLGLEHAAAAPRPDAAVDAALDRGQDTVDLVVRVPATALGAAERLEALLAEADEHCRRADLMTLARPPALQAFTAWYLEQFRAQLQGGPPTPYAGPLDV